ncbi:MAG: fluoride efflux transporter CrcB [Bacteroidetes bacterium]|jgi:CrcB protein|nr:fluoride efflux transporter CrcB [Bacteroidota bacterium]
MIYRHLPNILWVAFGGACGTLLRYWTNQLFKLVAGEMHLLSAATLENLLGSLLMGILVTVLTQKKEGGSSLRLFLLTGLLGSYTTYSGFMTEAFIHFSESYTLFFFYLFFQVISGVGLLLAGVRATKYVMRSP